MAVLPHEIFELTLPASSLKKLPQHDAAFIVAMELAVNDFRFFAHMLFAHLNSRDSLEERIGRTYATVRTAICMRNINSRLYELYECVEEYAKTRERRGKSAIPDELISDWISEIASIKADKRHYEVMQNLRDGVTHHYSGNRLQKIISQFPDDYQFESFEFPPLRSNSTSYMAEDIAFQGTIALSNGGVEAFSEETLMEYMGWMLKQVTQVTSRRGMIFERFVRINLVQRVHHHRIEVDGDLIGKANRFRMPLFWE